MFWGAIIANASLLALAVLFASWRAAGATMNMLPHDPMDQERERLKAACRGKPHTTGHVSKTTPGGVFLKPPHADLNNPPKSAL